MKTVEHQQQIDKDTALCISLAARPSNIGTRFHNYLYAELDLNFVYKAFTTTDLAAAISGIRGLGIRGCGVSMPYKEACIPLLDELTDSARAIESVNTIVNDDGWLRAYNTDYLAIRQLLDAHAIPVDWEFVLRGSGGMAKAVLAALRDSGFTHGTLIARNAASGRPLADQYGFDFSTELPGPGAQLLINATPIGMAGAPEEQQLAFDEAHITAAEAVLDVVALPPETPLVLHAQALGKRVLSGAEIIKIQALEQFVLYTGIRPTDEQAQRASEYSRAPLGGKR